jgi:hypothetical protein
VTTAAEEVVRAVVGMPLPEYAERFLRIRTKEQGVQPFRFNLGQLYVHMKAERQLADRGFVRISMLKARQYGGSTYIQGRFYSQIARGGAGIRTYILTHHSEATNNLFGMTHRFHNGLDTRLRPTSPRPSQKRLVFPRLDSSYAVATAGSDAVGRSDTIQRFHGSEVAFWPRAADHLAGALQAVPARGFGTEVWLESTGNGIGNAFHTNFTIARAGKSEFEAVFVPWFWFDEYRAPVEDLDLNADDADYMELWGLDEEQMQFRQNKIMEFGGGEAGRAKFMAEYPAVPEEAFAKNIKGGYIDAKYVLMARRRQAWAVRPLGPRILGLDPSYTGEDHFISFMRQGRLAWRVGRWSGLRTTQSLPRLAAIIERERPDIICIDVGGPGAGIYDQVVELYRGKPIVVVPVLGGERADDPERWRNKTAENWGRMKEWFEGPVGPCIIDRVASSPTAEERERALEEIQGDITNPLMDWDNKGRPVRETKKKILTHSPSPNNGDSLATTFSIITGPDWKPSDTDMEHARRPINPWAI